MGLEIIKEINVDFHNTRYIQVNAKQCDTSSRFISVTCYNQGSIFPIDNIYNHAYIRYRKSDYLDVFNSCDITEDGKILIELTEQMLAFDGKCYADVIIVHNEPIPISSIVENTGKLISNENTGVLSTMLFCINVIETALDNSEIESTNEYDALNELLIEAHENYEYVIKMCKISEENAKQSEIYAKRSEENAAVSESNAKTSEENADISEANAKVSESNAKTSEVNAKAFEESASNYADIATTKALEASQFVDEFANNVQASADSAEASANSAQASADKAVESSNYAILSQSYAVGGTGVRTEEDVDNSKYYYSQTKLVVEGMGGRFAPQGTIKFEELSTVNKEAGFVYHIEDAFVTDDTFREGAGVSYPMGTTIYYTVDGYWDCFVEKNLVVTDDGEGNVEIVCTYDFIATYENPFTQTITELQERLKALEDKNVLEIVE